MRSTALGSQLSYRLSPGLRGDRVKRRCHSSHGTLSIGGRPAAHPMLAHASGHAQAIHIEHADEIVACFFRPDDRLRCEYRCQSPDVARLFDLGELLLEPGVARLYAVDDARCEIRAHEAHLRRRPRSNVIRVPAAAHAHVSAPVTLAYD